MPGVDARLRAQSGRLNVTPICWKSRLCREQHGRLCRNSAFHAEGVVIRPRQTSSSRPQSGVTKLMSFQDSCAKATDASVSFMVWPDPFQIIPVISPIISVIFQIIPVIILFFPVIIFEVLYAGKALNVAGLWLGGLELSMVSPQMGATFAP